MKYKPDNESFLKWKKDGEEYLINNLEPGSFYDFITSHREIDYEEWVNKIYPILKEDEEKHKQWEDSVIPKVGHLGVHFNEVFLCVGYDRDESDYYYKAIAVNYDDGNYWLHYRSAVGRVFWLNETTNKEDYELLRKWWLENSYVSRILQDNNIKLQ